MKEVKGAYSAESKTQPAKRLGKSLRAGRSYLPRIIDSIMQQPGTTDSCVPIGIPIFEAMPSSLVFAVDSALTPQKLTLRLRNRDAVVRRVRVLAPALGPFTVALACTPQEKEQGLMRSDARVAPGLDVAFEVTFSPVAKRAYDQELIVVTEREKFVVTVIAREHRVVLDFPAGLFFGEECLVHHVSEKPALMYNKSEKPAFWEIRVQGCFSCNKIAGTLESGCFDQLIFGFVPPQPGRYSSQGVLLCNGEETRFELGGRGVNGDVGLSTNRLFLPETYLSLESHSRVKIFNRTNSKIDFQWKAYSSEEEETRRKALILAQLAEEEKTKWLILMEASPDPQVDSKDAELQREKALGVLQRKYALLRKEVEMDSMTFEDENFKIDPSSGIVWPNSELTINITFTPVSAIVYHQQVFCRVSCCESRLPLMLQGEALGPQAYLSTSTLSLGDVYIYEQQTLTVFIENRGEIPINFEREREGSQSEAVSFSIEEGSLAVEQRAPIDVLFKCRQIGEFSEQFRWKLQGSPEMLVLNVKANVRPPSFEFDRRTLDFGLVAFQFEETREIVFRNTSRVAFSFVLRMSLLSEDETQELVFTPTKDDLKPNEARRVVVKFTPKRRGVYRSNLILDMVDIGKDLFSLPVVADVRIPVVSVQPAVLDFGNVYLRYAETREIELINHSRFSARFIVRPLNPRFELVGKVIPSLEKGQIPADQRVKLGITLIAACLETVELDLFVEIVSDEESLHCVHVVAHSIGPSVELSHTDIDFGDVSVLSRVQKTVTIVNRSSIEADFVAFTAAKDSVFAPVQTRHVLQPSESFDVEIACIADDNVRFSDVLHLKIKEGMDKEVRLRARGVGHTIFAPDLRCISFGALYTHRSEIIEAFVENKGRRPYALQWKRRVENVGKETFAVFPESVVLPSHSGLMFQFRAFSSDPGTIEEVFTLLASVGAERKARQILSTSIDANFTRPTINFSSRSITFTYAWQKDVTPTQMTQEIDIENAGILPVNFETMIDWPFSVSPDSLALLPAAKATLQVGFDPSLKTDHISTCITEKLHLKHLRHPRSDALDVMADFSFPTLTIEDSKVDFGVVLNHTSKKIYLILQNHGSIPASYSWHFLDSGNLDVRELSETFDILPAHGTINPGEQETTEFSFSPKPFTRFHVTALCRVEGGADCPVQLLGEASDVAYSLSLAQKKNTLDFGDMFVGERVVREFDIENTSKVAFDFRVFVDTKHSQAGCSSELIKITPSSANLSGGKKIKVRVTVVAGFSGILRKNVTVRVAHFEPETITLAGTAKFASLAFEALLKLDESAYAALDTFFSTDLKDQAAIGADAQISLQARGLPKIYAQARSCDDVETVQTIFGQLSSTERIEFERIRIRKEMEARFSKAVGESLMTNDGAPAVEFIGSICLGTYIVDLGNIVGGSKVTKEVVVRSLSSFPVAFSLNLRNYAGLGLSVGPSRSFKLETSEERLQESIVFSLQTKKTARPGPAVFSLPVEIESGLLYMLEIQAHISIPQVTLSQPEVDFGQVFIGNVLRWSLFIENTSFADCNWYTAGTTSEMKRKSQRKELHPSCFFVMPSSGKLVPGQRQYVEVFFEPLEAKKLISTLVLACKDSSRQTELVCRGEGVVPVLKFSPKEINFETTLPGHRVMHPVEVCNETGLEVELIARDVDAVWLKEARLLSNLDESGALANTRRADDEFWPTLAVKLATLEQRKAVSRRLSVQEREALTAAEPDRSLSFIPLADPPEVSGLAPLIDTLPEEYRGYYVIESGHTTVSQRVGAFISKEHSKAFLDLDAMVEDISLAETEIGRKVSSHISQKKTELAAMMDEAARRKDKRANDVGSNDFFTLPYSILQEALSDRLSSLDCRRGAVIINSESKYSRLANVVSILKGLFPSADVQTVLIVADEEKLPPASSVPSNELSGTNIAELSDSGREHSSLTDPLNSYYLISPKLAEKLSSEKQREETLSELQERADLPETPRSQSRELTLRRWNEEHPEAKVVYFPHNWTKLNYLVLSALPDPPNPPPEALPLPAPRLFQRVKRPTALSKPKPMRCFEIYTYRDQLDQNSESDKDIGFGNSNELSQLFIKGQTRWVIPANSSLHLCIAFFSEDEGEALDSFSFCHSTALFAAVKHDWVVNVRGRTALPNINRNPRNIFTFRRKSAANLSQAIFSTTDGVLDFGALLIGHTIKDPPTKHHLRHSSSLRLTNDSPLEVKLTVCKASSLPDTQGTSFESVPHIFYVEKDSHVIAPSSTLELTIWALPQAVGVFSETLLVCIEDNPDPLCVPLLCEGCKIQLAVASKTMIFTRQLVGKSATQTATLMNSCRLPLEWKCLNSSSAKAVGVTLEAESGLLLPSEQKVVMLTFQPQNAETKQVLLEFEACDVEKRGNRATAQLDVRTESFQVGLEIAGFSTASSMLLDFGKTTVGKSVARPLTLKNTSAFPITVEVVFSLPQMKSAFCATPNRLPIPPRGVQTVKIDFLALDQYEFSGLSKQSAAEFRILEDKTDAFYKELTFNLKASAEFIQPVIKPSQLCDFGPLIFSSSKTAYFDILNKSVNELIFELYDANSATQAADVRKRLEIEADPKAKPRPRAVARPGSLTISQFTITPFTGVIEPGGELRIESIFKGKDEQTCEARLRLEFTGRDLRQDIKNFDITLRGESCFPSIETQNYAQIFEDHSVQQTAPSLFLGQGISNVFIVEENVFLFGNIFLTKNLLGITERFKLVNRSQVSAKICSEIVRKSPGTLAFSIVGAKNFVIEPHSFTHIRVNFNPDIMNSFEATLNVVVENAQPNGPGSKLTFDLRGQGVLPTLRLEKEVEANFGRLRVNSTKSQAFTLRNTGLIPATAAILVDPPNAFTLSASSRAIAPNESSTFDLAFKPPTTGCFPAQLTIMTQDNPFERSVYTLSGEGFQEDLVFEGLGKAEDFLDFGETVVDASSPETISRTFSVRNTSQDTLRFAFGSNFDSQLSIRPRAGHLAPGMAKKVDVRLNISAKYPWSFFNEVSVSTAQIRLKDQGSSLRKWDDQKQVKMRVSREEREWIEKVSQLQKAYAEEKALNPRAKPPVYPPRPQSGSEKTEFVKQPWAEPEYETLANSSREVKLKVSAQVDLARITLDQEEILFEKTFLYSSKSHTFSILNESSAKIDFVWEFFERESGTVDEGFFTILPAQGIIEGRQKKDFTIHFLPTEVDGRVQRQLGFKIKGLKAPLKVLSINGEVERPLCHVDLPATYEADERIVDVEAIGSKKKVQKRFQVINTTGLKYYFGWTETDACNTDGRGGLHFLECLTPEGAILPGKRTEMIFEFDPSKASSNEVRKSFTFRIIGHPVQEFLTFRCFITEPKVLFTTSRFDFGPLLLQAKATETIFLKNIDSVAHNFSFSKKALKGLSNLPRGALSVSPATGIIGPTSELPITLSFSPPVEGEYCYNLCCLLDNKKEPLHFSVKAHGYKLHYEVLHNRKNITLTSHYFLDIGEVLVDEVRREKFVVANKGAFNLDFSAALKSVSRAKKQVSKPKPMSRIRSGTRESEDVGEVLSGVGTVSPDCVTEFELCVKPITAGKVSFVFLLSIICGIGMEIEISCVAKFPQIEITPKEVNLGMIPIGKSAIRKTIDVLVKNKESQPISIQCESSGSSEIEVSLITGQMVMPYCNQKENLLRFPINLIFTDLVKLDSEVTFLVNSKNHLSLPIKAETVAVSLEVINSSHIIDLGNSFLAKATSKNVKLRNNSKISISVSFDVSNMLKELKQLGFTLKPTSLLLSPKATADVQVTFQPFKRVKVSEFPLVYEIKESSTQAELFKLSGQGIVAAARLSDTILDFGQIVVKATTSKSLQAINNGDLPLVLEWELSGKSGPFTISPSIASIDPNSAATFKVEFLPPKAGEFKVTTRAHVKELDDPLCVSFFAAGVPFPTEKSLKLSFEAAPQQSVTNVIEIQNTSSNKWTLRPDISTIDGEHGCFRLPSTFEIPPNTTYKLEVCYCPHENASASRENKALLFLAKPDGTAIQFELTGRLLPTLPLEKIRLNTTAKEFLMHNFTLENKKSVEQRLEVSATLLPDEKEPLSEGIVLKFPKTAHLLPSSVSSFPSSFYGLKAGKFTIQLLFTDISSKNFSYYIVELEIKEPLALKTLTLSSNVREQQKFIVPVANPLKHSVTIDRRQITFDCPCITLLTKDPLVIHASKEAILEFSYFPLIEYKKEPYSLKILSDQLGSFPFTLILESKPSTEIPSIAFTSSLGMESTNKFRVSNYLSVQCQFALKIEKLDNTGQTPFTLLQSTVSVEASCEGKPKEVEVPIKYEPASLEDSRALVTATSPQGGTFKAYLLGNAILPLPKGPFKITPKGGSVEFKNPYNESTEFKVRLEGACFQTQCKNSVKIDAKKNYVISIVYKHVPDQSTTGRIVIGDSKGTLWVFFLQGVL